MKRGAWSKVWKTAMPKVLRSKERLQKLHAESLKEQKRLAEEKLQAERRAGLRV